MIAILRDEMGQGPFAAVLHCFTSGAALAEAGLALGLYVSFSGVITFKTSEALRAIARSVPLDRMLVETDAPFLSPVPLRGKRNEPANVVHTARLLAEVKGIDLAAFGEATSANVPDTIRQDAAAGGGCVTLRLTILGLRLLRRRAPRRPGAGARAIRKSRKTAAVAAPC